MKPNPKKYYITIGNTIYSLTQKQYDKAMSMIGDLSKNEDKFFEGLDYVQEVGRKEFELDGMYNY